MACFHGLIDGDSLKLLDLPVVFYRSSVASQARPEGDGTSTDSLQEYVDCWIFDFRRPLFDKFQCRIRDLERHDGVRYAATVDP